MHINKLWDFNQEYINMIGSFCSVKTLVALSQTNTDATQRMAQIWIRRLETSFALFFPEFHVKNGKSSCVHFTKMIYIEGPCNIFDRKIVLYNKYLIKKFPQLVGVDAHSPKFAKIVRNIFFQYNTPKIFNLYRNNGKNFAGNFQIERMMNAIACQQYDLFHFLDLMRRFTLSKKGYKEMLDCLKNNHNEDNPSIIIGSFDQVNFEKYKYFHREITHDLLAFAAQQGKAKIVQYLLEKYPNIDKFLPFNIPRSDSLFPFYYFQTFQEYASIHSFLIYAAFYGHASVVKLLVDRNADVNFKEYNCDYYPGHYKLVTPLICAVAGGYLPVVQVLLEAKASPNVYDNDDKHLETPLGLAVRTGNIKVTRALLSAKADPNTLSWIWTSLVDYSYVNGEEVFINRYTSPIIIAIKSAENFNLKKIKLVNLLLASKAEVNSEFEPHPLEVAAKVAAKIGDAFLIQLLLAAKANVEGNNGSPLRMAVRMHHLDAVQLLIRAQADPNHVDVLFNNFPPPPGTRASTSETVSLLLHLKADPNRCYKPDDPDHRPLLMRAIHDLVSVRVLLEARADCNHANENGETALMKAAGEDSRNSGVVHVLLEARADCNLADSKGKTALIHAVQLNVRLKRKRGGAIEFLLEESEYNYIDKIYDLANELIKNGARVAAADNEGNTAFRLVTTYLKYITEDFDTLGNELKKIKKLLSRGLASLNASNEESLFTDSESEGDSVDEGDIDEGDEREMDEFETREEIEMNDVNTDSIDHQAKRKKT